MKPYQYLLFSILFTLSPCALLAEVESKDIPDPPVAKLYSESKSQPNNKELRLAKNIKILAESRKCLAEYSDVHPTAVKREILVRRIMLPAAERIFYDSPTAENRAQLRKIAEQVVTLPVYEGHRMVSEKVRAAVTLVRLDIFPENVVKPVDAEKHIRALIAYFPTRPELEDPDSFTGQAIVYGARLAFDTGQKALSDEYCAKIAKSFLSTSNALATLIYCGHAPVFEAEMTTLDGEKISFPADTKGKVVLLDFWATWCRPCIASMPHIEELTKKYKGKDVMIIGVSCDVPFEKETEEQNKAKVAKFISDKGYSWTQTYAGKWPEAAVKYGVSRIPSVFVIGKDGVLVSADARNQEETFIEKALATP